MHELAMLPAKRAEAPEVRNDGEIAGLLGDGRRGRRARRGLLDQPAQRLHIVAQVVVDLPKMEPRFALGLGQPLQLRRPRARGVVEKVDVVNYGADISAPADRSRRHIEVRRFSRALCPGS